MNDYLGVTSPNTGYMAHFVRPNFVYAQALYMLKCYRQSASRCIRKFSLSY